MILSSLLLISSDIYSFETSSRDEFSVLLSQVESLKNESPSQALRLLGTYQSKYSDLNIEDQLKYVNLETEINIDQAKYLAAKTSADKALLLTKRLASPSIIIAQLFYLRGFAVESLGDLTQATQDYLSGLDISTSLNNKKHIAEGLINLGAIYYLTEKYERSLIVLNDALVTASELDDNELLGQVNSELGNLYSYLHQEDKAMRFYQKAYEHFSKAGKELLAINSLRNIAVNHGVNFRYEKAIILYKKIIAIADKFTNDELMGTVYSGMAWAHLYKDAPDPEAAYQYILIAGQYAANAQQYGFQLFHETDKAYVLFELKRYEEALQSIDAASKLTSSQAAHLVNDSTLGILNLKAKIYFAMEEFELAYQHQSAYLHYGLSLRDSYNSKAIEELRLKYESEQFDLQRKLLVEKQTIQSLKLNEIKEQAINRQLFIVFIILILLSLAWLLVRTYKGKNHFFNAKKVDTLTKLINRHHMIILGEKAVSSAYKNKKTLSILLFSIDHYKKLNLHLSNELMGELLKLVAGCGKLSLRGNEKLSRFGENEFVVLLGGDGVKRHMEFGQQFNSLITAYLARKTDIQELSVSIGKAKMQQESQQTFASLVKDAMLSLKCDKQKKLDDGEPK
ncbi:MAG: diguanylate cyclase (GGDEF)-like protein [Alteromonadaceae bacterium]